MLIIILISLCGNVDGGLKWTVVGAATLEFFEERFVRVQAVLRAQVLHPVRVVVDHRLHGRVDVAYALYEVFERGRGLRIVDFVTVLDVQHPVPVLDDRGLMRL